MITVAEYLTKLQKRWKLRWKLFGIGVAAETHSLQNINAGLLKMSSLIAS
jgi:hypothetical protein